MTLCQVQKCIKTFSMEFQNYGLTVGTKNQILENMKLHTLVWRFWAGRVHSHFWYCEAAVFHADGCSTFRGPRPCWCWGRGWPSGRSRRSGQRGTWWPGPCGWTAVTWPLLFGNSPRSLKQLTHRKSEVDFSPETKVWPRHFSHCL